MNSARHLAGLQYVSLMTAILQFLIEGALNNCAKAMFSCTAMKKPDSGQGSFTGALIKSKF